MNKAVIFDLDGTILDTLTDIAENINRMLDHFGYPKLPSREIMQYIGNGARNLVKRSIKVKLTEEELDDKLAFYNRIYTAAPSDNTCVFKGLDEVISQLKERGYKTGVLTNKPQMTTDKVCEKYLSHLNFDVIVGQREGVPIKPDPTSLNQILKDLNVKKENAYFVGDGETDAQTAQNAGVNGICVLWGYRERKQLEAVGATVFVSSPQQLLKIIK